MASSAIEWVCFIVLNIGLPTLEELSPGMRALAGIFQSLAVRASGLQIVSIATLAPAFQWVSRILRLGSGALIFVALQIPLHRYDVHCCEYAYSPYEFGADLRGDIRSIL